MLPICRRKAGHDKFIIPYLSQKSINDWFTIRCISVQESLKQEIRMKKTDYRHEGLDIVKEYLKEAKEFPYMSKTTY